MAYANILGYAVPLSGLQTFRPVGQQVCYNVKNGIREEVMADGLKAGI